MNSENQILTFPAGLVSRKRRGKIRDVEWKKSFISKAVQYKRDIIPIHVSGRCSDFFYNLANLRKFLGIRSNIEMFYLPDETYRHKNEHIEISIGPPVTWQTFEGSRKPVEWALLMQDYVYSLPGNVNIPFNPDK
jgi:putative hemolysin